MENYDFQVADLCFEKLCFRIENGDTLNSLQRIMNLHSSFTSLTVYINSEFLKKHDLGTESENRLN